MTAATVFDSQRLGVRFGSVVALQDCSLRVQAGERLALVGANGCGKSTLLRCLHGLIKPSEGRLERAAVTQAMVFQRPFMLRTSALNNVALGLWLRGTRWREARLRAAQALERVGLSAQARQSGRWLSGGQQQRLALARAWALGAQVLLLDEPTAGLDPSGKREIEALMAEFAGGGMTLIFSSHNLGQVKRLADRVLYLEAGRIKVDAPTERFFTGPLPESTAAFLRGEWL
jgi:tungstate transport system ATP-binding protein